jgi:hypothetical protein
MPTIEIPDKICSHCGGTRWYVYYENHPLKKDPTNKRLRYKCTKKKIEKDVRKRKRRMASLSEEERKSFNRKMYERYKDQVLLKQKEKRRVYRLNNPIVKKSEEEKKEAIIRSQKKYRLKNKNNPLFIERRRQKDRRDDARQIKNLANVYVRKMLKIGYKLPVECITDDVISKYKIYLTLKRQLKQLENERKSKIS